MSSKESSVVAIEVLNRLINERQLSDVASEIQYIEDPQERLIVVSHLLEACCETENHELVVKICATTDTKKLSAKLRKKLRALADTCEVNDDFMENIPTLVGHSPF